MTDQPSYPPPPPSTPGAAYPQGPYPGYNPAPPGPQGYVPPPDGPQGYVAPPPAARRSNRRGVLVLAVVVIVIVAALGGYFLFRDQLSGNVNDLQVGDCIDIPFGSDSVSDVQHHPCTEPHDAEVFALATDPSSGDYPAVDHFDSLANAQCVPEATAYLGVDLRDRTDLSGGFFYPSSDSWTNSNDRVIDCYFTRADGSQLSGSVRNIGSSPLP